MGQYSEKGSKFLAFAWPVETEEEIRSKIISLKKQYFDARHYCYAWVLGPGKDKFRAYDDGEPNHSAGDPILGQIRSNDLTHVLIVVVRYFGGVKLGVGGLVSAYRTASAEALKNAVVVVKDVMVGLTIEYDYACSPEVMKLVKEFGLHILEQTFGDRGRMEVTVRLALKEKLKERFTGMKRTMKLDVLWR